MINYLRGLPLLALLTTAQAGVLDISVVDAAGKPTQDVIVLVERAGAAAPVAPAAPVEIRQERLKFVPFLTVVPVGATVRFVNGDTYDHHVRSGPSGPLSALPAAQNFEFRLDGSSPQSAKKAGTSAAEVKLDKAGPTGLGCHLHSSMRGQLFAAATPYFGKTDAAGRLTIDKVPDGPVKVRLWHPDQLQDQPAIDAVAAPQPTPVAGKLNFTVRSRKT